MLFSIIIPVYNCEKYIAECLESCFQQGIAESEYEIICVDDGSTDQSAEVVSAFCGEHRNLKLIRQKNGGVSAARNTGLDHAAGEYVWFIDADDFIQSNILRIVADILSTHKYDKIMLRAYSFKETLSAEEMEQKSNRNMPSWHEYGTICVQILKLEIIAGHSIRFCTDMAYAEDLTFSYLFSAFCKDSFLLPEVAYFYRQHAGSASDITEAGKREKWISSHVSGAIVLQSMLDKIPVEKRDQLYLNMCSFLSTALDGIAKRSDDFARDQMGRLKKASLFPLKSLESKNTKGYILTRNDVIGKVVNWAYRNDYTILGFAALKLWYQLNAVIHHKRRSM